MFSNQPLHIWISSAEKKQKDVNLYYFLVAFFVILPERSTFS